MRRLYHGHQLQGKPLPSNPWVQNIFALQLILNLKKIFGDCGSHFSVCASKNAVGWRVFFGVGGSLESLFSLNRRKNRMNSKGKSDLYNCHYVKSGV